MSTWKMIYFIAAAGTTLVWLLLYLVSGKKYKNSIDAVKDTPFLKDTFGIGFLILSLIRYSCDTSARKRKIRRISEVEDERSAVNCFLLLRAGEITYSITFLPIGFILAILSETPEAALLGPVLAMAGIALLERTYRRKQEEKKEKVLMQLPTVVSKLVLLMNSGMILRDAWKMVSERGNGVLYDEMKRVSEDIRNGHMEIDAYRRFSERCSGQETRKFTAIILQNLSKGNEELLRYLTDLSTEMWEVKKSAVQKKADSATRKLLFPMVLVFSTVLAMVIVPMLSGIGF